MKNFTNLSIVALFFLSCGGGDDSTPTPEVINNAPTVPTLVTPVDNKLCVDSSVDFQWNLSTDADNDPIIYQIQIALDNQFAQIVKKVDVSTVALTIALNKNTAYYWRVKGTDSKGLSGNYSATYKFYTAGGGVINHLPFVPELVQPTLNTSLNTSTATLKWNASDVDINDVLSYDVYFGTTNPPTLIKTNNTINTYAVSLSSTKTYFWKVVVKDDKGGETIGQVWTFKTN